MPRRRVALLGAQERDEAAAGVEVLGREEAVEDMLSDLCAVQRCGWWTYDDKEVKEWLCATMPVRTSTTNAGPIH